MTESKAKAAFNELLDTLRDASERWAGAEWNVSTPDDVGEAMRNLTHILQSGLFSHQETDPDRPVFNRIVSPTRSFTGDNADAVYFETAVSGEREYVVRGNLAGGVYTSFTMEAGAVDGKYATATAGVLRDDDMDVDADGNYEIRLGGAPAERNWLGIPAEGGRITTRHYFEWPTSSAASQMLHIPLSIEALPAAGPKPRWSDDSVATAIRRVNAHVRSKTVDAAKPGTNPPAPFASMTPNVFPAPVVPGNMALSAFDAAYSMAPYRLGPDEALVITGRWPECRFANVCLWNRFSQMYDYVNRPVSRNRANTVLEADGSFRMVLAHEDPGVPNWLDTEGRPSGTLFWRFFLPEGPVETPQAQVVKFADLAR
jgi:hypothetical protein